MDSSNAGPLQKEWWSFLAALMFYSRIPIPKNTPHSQLLLDQSRRYFPLIGAIIGTIGIITIWAAAFFWSPELAIILSMTATIWSTGAFHEDGFADCCDGFGGGWDTTQVLTIMKDSRVGTYAVVALVLLLSTKFFALLYLLKLNTMLVSASLLAGHILSRLLSSLVVDFFDYVQDIDASKAKPMTMRRLNLVDHTLGSLLTVVSLTWLALVIDLGVVLTAVIAAILAAWLMARYSKRRIGGYTGDVLGAIQQLSELAFYLFLIAAI